MILVIFLKEVSRNTASVWFRIHSAKWTPVRCSLSQIEQGYIYVWFTIKEEDLNITSFIKVDRKQAVFPTFLLIFPFYPSIFLLFLLFGLFEFSSIQILTISIKMLTPTFFPIPPPACSWLSVQFRILPWDPGNFSFKKKQVMFS